MIKLATQLLNRAFEGLNLQQYFSLTANPFFWVDLGFIVLFFWLVFRFVHRTRGERIIWGIGILVLLWLVAAVLRLQLVTVVLRFLFASMIVAIPVVFQPELRAGLERLGRSTRLVADWRKLTQSEIEHLAGEVLEAVRILAKNRFGAIVVFTRLAGLREYIEDAEPVYARVGARLLVSIFYPKNPLHDGAVIISGNRIVAARVTLPLSDESDLTLGTRHRAGLGIAEQTDAVAIVVSEETGKVSLAYDSKLVRRITYDKLANELRRLLGKTLETGSASWRLLK